MPELHYAQSYTHQDHDFDAQLASENPANLSPGDDTAVGREPVRDESDLVSVSRADLPAGFVGKGHGGSTVEVPGKHEA